MWCVDIVCNFISIISAYFTLSTIRAKWGPFRQKDGKEREREKGLNEEEEMGAHMENCLSLASMLRCLIHILVRAEPMSLVPPETRPTTQAVRQSLLKRDLVS